MALTNCLRVVIYTTALPEILGNLFVTDALTLHADNDFIIRIHVKRYRSTDCGTAAGSVDVAITGFWRAAVHDLKYEMLKRKDQIATHLEIWILDPWLFVRVHGDYACIILHRLLLDASVGI